MSWLDVEKAHFSCIIGVVNVLSNAGFFLDFLFSFFVFVQISQSDRCNIDHPKMPRISKRANLYKDFKAVAKSQVIRLIFSFA